MNSCNWLVGIGLVLFSVCMIGCSDDVQKDAEGDRPGSYTLINGQWYWMDNPNYDPGPRIPPPASLKASLYVQYPDANKTELMKAVRDADAQHVQHLLESGENPNVNVYADLTVLDFALSIGRPDIVDILISAGAK
jgi:hypothetical protein